MDMILWKNQKTIKI